MELTQNRREGSASTLTRSGIYYGRDLGERLRRFSDKFRRFPSALNLDLDHIKYGLYVQFPESYFMILTNNQTEPPIPGYTTHNTVLTVTSSSPQLNVRQSRRLEKIAGIDLGPAPRDLSRSMSNLSHLFPALREHSEEEISCFFNILNSIHARC